MFKTIKEIKQANRSRGYHFFDDASMKFFNSRIETGVLHGEYFITSEQFNYTSPRLFTIRKVKANGQVITIGEFQHYRSLDEAIKALEN